VCADTEETEQKSEFKTVETIPRVTAISSDYRSAVFTECGEVVNLFHYELSTKNRKKETTILDRTLGEFFQILLLRIRGARYFGGLKF
jgi:hypothetical protein